MASQSDTAPSTLEKLMLIFLDFRCFKDPGGEWHGWRRCTSDLSGRDVGRAQPDRRYRGRGCRHDDGLTRHCVDSCSAVQPMLQWWPKTWSSSKVTEPNTNNNSLILISTVTSHWFDYYEVTKLLVEFFVHIGLSNIKYSFSISYLQFLTWLSVSGLPSK